MLGYYPQLGDGARAEAGRAVQPGLHPTRILDLYTQSLTPTGRGYELITSGTCASRGLLTITATTQCKEALTALGRSVSRVGTVTSHAVVWGCYYYVNQHGARYAYVNTNTANKENRKATTAYQSVCAGETNV